MRSFTAACLGLLATVVVGCGDDSEQVGPDPAVGGAGGGDCTPGCDPPDATRCQDNVVERCIEVEGCLSWELETDCDALGQLCDPTGTEAACQGLECSEPGGGALELNGDDEYVTMGVASDLGLEAFTLEAWVRWSGGGRTAGSGAGGVTGFPIITKGRGESDGSEVDCNYFFGIRSSTGTLAADFEDMSSGANHPVYGSTPLEPGQWVHVAATYDGQTWRLYVDGILDGEQWTGATPRYDSVQHFALGAALNSSGTPSGALGGALDEVRVWDRALSAAELRAGLEGPLTIGDGLIARWALDETAGETVSDSVGSTDGTALGGQWVTPGAPFAVDPLLTSPEQVSPVDGSVAGTDNVPLSVWIDTRGDGDDEPVEVTFWGRQVDRDFSVVVLPDTQYYSESYPWIFTDQTAWVVQNQARYNIRAVLHAGDVTDNGDSSNEEWLNADAAMSLLESSQPGLPDGIPYGLAVGNHDQTPNGDPGGTTIYFNQYFGSDRFEGRNYYGGHYGTNNNNHYILFEADTAHYLGLFLEYDPSANPLVLDWAREVIDAHPDHRVVVTVHSLINGDAEWSDQGLATYEALKDLTAIDLMICGHIGAEAMRTDTFADHDIHTLLADYQFRDDGGNGSLRILFFSPARGVVEVRTISTMTEEWETDEDSDFVLPYDPPHAPLEPLGSHMIPTPGTVVSHSWAGLSADSVYQWTVTARNCYSEQEAPLYYFRTAPGD